MSLSSAWHACKARWSSLLFDPRHRVLFAKRRTCWLEVSPREIARLELPKRFLQGIHVQEITGKHARFLHSRFGSRGLPAVFNRFRLGDRCWGAISQGRLIGHEWTSMRHQTERDTRYRLKLPPDSVYLYDGWVDPEFRSRGVLILILNQLFQDPQIQQAQRVITLVEPDNRASLKTVLRFNFRIHKHLEVSRWLGMTISQKMIAALPPMTEPATPRVVTPAAESPAREEISTR